METLSDLVFRIREISSGSSDLLSFRAGNRRETLSTADFLRSTHSLAVALEARGLRQGERVAIYSENRPEWHMVDFACQLLGAITVSVPANLSPAPVGFILRNSSCRWVFFDGIDRSEILASLESTLTSSPDKVAFNSEAATPDGLSMTRLMGEGAERLGNVPIERYRGRVGGQEPASLIYSEDPTGEPEGLWYSHEQMVDRMLELRKSLDVASDDRMMSTLPLSQILQRSIDHLCFYRGATIHFLSSNEQIPVALRLDRATILAAEPEILEELHRLEDQHLARMGPGKRWLYRRALEIGKRNVAATQATFAKPLLALQLWLARGLILRKSRRRLGDQLRLAITVGRAVEPSTRYFFEILGVSLRQR